MEQDEIDAFGAALAARAVPVSVEEFHAAGGGWGCSPEMERALEIGREKNAAMRAVVDAICYPADR